MLVGGPGRPTSTGRAIHWHANPEVKIEYVYHGRRAADDPIRAID
jgi:hypothetical protein